MPLSDGWDREWAWLPHRVQDGAGCRWAWWEWVEMRAVGGATETWAIYRLPRN